MDAPKPHFAARLLPSLTDAAFLMPIAFLFLRMGGATGMLGDGDTGWHVRTGEWILANGRVPHEDIFSYTRAGQPWFAWEWLWDVVFGWLHQRAGMEAVILASVAVVCLTSVLLFRLICRKCGNPLLAIALMVLVTGGTAIHWLARPHLFTMLFTVIFYSILERVKDGNVRLLWCLPALTLLWTNLHGGFFLGIAMLGAYAAGEMADALFTSDSSRRQPALRRSVPYLMTAAACFAVTFINPYFYHLHQHIIAFLGDGYQYRNIVEFQSFDFHNPVASYFEPMLILGLGAAAWNLYRRQFTYSILLAGWAHLALVVVRNLPIFMIVAAPLVAEMLQSLLAELPVKDLAAWIRRSAVKFQEYAEDFGATDSMARVHLTSVAGMGLLAALFYAPNAPVKCRAEYDAKRYPAKAVDVLRQAGSPEVIFTDDEWGGYLIYRLYPSNRVFIDGRSDFYGTPFNEKYQSVMNVRYDWEKSLGQYHVNTILLSPKAALAGTLKESRHWRPVYDDGVAIVFRATEDRDSGAAQVSVATNDGKDRDRKITKSQTSDLTITKPHPRSEPS
ncbi:MAG TPA: hypothetical protein VNY30_16230 [Bryobacteraceae bacterium]|nr:hypothetical protein [Bryobacteraceae bacterium]